MTPSKTLKQPLPEATSFTTRQVARGWQRLAHSLLVDKNAESVNVVFDECRMGVAMRRVLCFYGVIPASSVFNDSVG
ncbi:hypothetical protein CDT99_22000 [Cronobacter sakazakii]|nr:hypothetical protein [Cronobacter muytjensii]PQV82392.1 hypothetical protein CDT99_22000 [Cronobacter sakazakii]